MEIGGFEPSNPALVSALLFTSSSNAYFPKFAFVNATANVASTRATQQKRWEAFARGKMTKLSQFDVASLNLIAQILIFWR